MDTTTTYEEIYRRSGGRGTGGIQSRKKYCQTTIREVLRKELNPSQQFHRFQTGIR